MGICWTKISPQTIENFKLAVDKLEIVKKYFDQNDELIKLLIDTLCTLSCSYKKTNLYGKWQESFERTRKVCNEVRRRCDENNDSTSEFYFNACEKYFFSLYQLGKYTEFREEFESIKSNFQNNHLLIYLNILTTKMYLDEKKKESLTELRQDLMSDCENFLQLKSINPNKIKTANVKYIHGCTLLIDGEYEDALQKLEDAKRDLNEMSEIKFNEGLDQYLTESIDEILINFCILKSYYKLNEFQKVINCYETFTNLLSYMEGLNDTNFMWAASNISLKNYNSQIEEKLLKVSRKSEFYIESKKILGKHYFNLQKYEDAVREISMIDDRSNNGNDIQLYRIISLYRIGFKFYEQKSFSRGIQKFNEVKEKLNGIDNKFSLAKTFYLSWSLFFLNEFKELENLMNKNRGKEEISLEVFYEFNFLNGVCLIENHKFDQFDEAKKELLLFLSINEQWR